MGKSKKSAGAPLKASMPTSASKKTQKQKQTPKDVQEKIKTIENSDTESSDHDSEEEDDEDDEDEDEFEQQDSSDDELEEEDEQEMTEAEQKTRKFTVDREKQIKQMREDGSLQKASALHVDDLSSDDEEDRNTIGNVPLRWYDDYDHIGYDREGKKIMKSNSGDGIDNAIAAKDDPNYDRTVYDAYNDRNIVLSDRDLEILRRIQAGAFAHPEFEAEPDAVDTTSSDKLVHGLGNPIEPKARFIPSKWERMKILQIAQGLREGRIKYGDEAHGGEAKKKPDNYQLWFDDDQAAVRKGPAHIPPPKMPLPGHIESYNPPEEFLFTEEEKKAWEEMDPEDRETNFIPQKFESLRAVSGYKEFVRERFERCLDLYLAPRVNKRRLNIDPESLVPQLPKPRDLRPFPNTLELLFTGHTGRVRSVDFDPTGQYIASGSDDGTVRIWETETARCLQVYRVSDVVVKVKWNPNRDHVALAVAAGKKVLVIATGTGSADQQELTNALLGEASEPIAMHLNESNDIQEAPEVEIEEDEEEIAEADKRKRAPVTWKFYTGTTLDKHAEARHWMGGKVGSGVRVVLHHSSEVKDFSWHHKGDYIATVVPSAQTSAVLIHQLSKRKTQNPFKKNVGQVQAVAFHPSKPFFFHATQRHVRIYNLVKQSLVKKLTSGVKWISSMAVHPNGDHLLVGSYDRRLCWFDLDLASTPYKTLKYHERALRSVNFHTKYPLMSSASDDGTIHVFHSMVYSDLMKNPLIVPLKILRGHEVTGGLGVMSTSFHPHLPWILSGGADGHLRLFQNIH